jgi:RHS repeat-associated protein
MGMPVHRKFQPFLVWLALIVAFPQILHAVSAPVKSKQGIQAKQGIARLTLQEGEKAASKARVCVRYDTAPTEGPCGDTGKAGIIQLHVEARPHQYRIERGQKIIWSRIHRIVPGEANPIHLDLDALTAEPTNNPESVPAAPAEPVWTPPNTILASTGDVSGTTSAPAAPAQIIYYYINDHLGRPVKMIDQDGEAVWEIGDEPFGGSKVAAADVTNHFRFPGQYFDTESGLHYNYFRYYDPTLGRYLRPDPIGLVGGLNPFSYAQNNPLNYVDPNGDFVLTGSVALGFIATKAVGIAVAWIGLQTATQLIGNPEIPSDNPCDKYMLGSFMNSTTLGIVAVNAGLGLGIAGVELGVTFYPKLVLMSGTPVGYRIQTEYFPSINPSILPSPTFPYGFFGYATGATIETVIQKDTHRYRNENR